MVKGSKFGAMVRKRRTEMEVSQTYLATELGLSVSHISNIEKGRRRVGADHLTKLSDVLSIDFKTLYDAQYPAEEVV